jgi:hypothetical protein
MKLIKTPLRNRLSYKILNALMLVATEGPALEEFDFAEAARIWDNPGRLSQLGFAGEEPVADLGEFYCN